MGKRKGGRKKLSVIGPHLGHKMHKKGGKHKRGRRK